MNLSGCYFWQGGTRGFSDLGWLGVGLVMVGGLMGVASMLRMLFKGMERGVLVFFVLGAALFLAG